MNTVWLASYPKSGNTFVRFMLYAAIFSPPKKSLEVASKIPDIHRPIPSDQPESGELFVKTHFELSPNHPNLSNTLRAIHIIRNPRDVMLSAINYRILTSDTPAQSSPGLVAKAFLQAKGDPHWKASGFGTWASNARSWRQTDLFPVLNVRYENLKSDPHSELTRMLEFLEIERSPEQIQQAVTASSFDSMRALEIREKRTDKSSNHAKLLFDGTKNATRKGVYFMNKGKSNQSLDALVPGLDKAFNERFADELKELGYTQ